MEFKIEYKPNEAKNAVYVKVNYNKLTLPPDWPDGVQVPAYPVNRMGIDQSMIDVFEAELNRLERSTPFLTTPTPNAVYKELIDFCRWYLETEKSNKIAYYKQLANGVLPKVTYPYNTDYYGNMYYTLSDITRDAFKVSFNGGTPNADSADLADLLTGNTYERYKRITEPYHYVPSPPFLAKLKVLYHGLTSMFQMYYTDSPEASNDEWNLFN